MAFAEPKKTTFICEFTRRIDATLESTLESTLEATLESLLESLLGAGLF